MSRRTDKVNELLRREIGTTIQRDFGFPGTIVTVIEVEVTDDLKEGKVWVGVVGKMAPSQVLEKLNSRHGLIQSAVARRVVLRNTPRLTFRLDDSAQRGVDLVNLLEDIDKNLPKAPLPMRKMTGVIFFPWLRHGVPGRTALDAPGQRRAGTRRITLPEKIRNGRQGSRAGRSLFP